MLCTFYYIKKILFKIKKGVNIFTVNYSIYLRYIKFLSDKLLQITKKGETIITRENRYPNQVKS